ncbi:unnamed protein product [Cyprideis torosa]|uniref:Uncharacterized protein n=1 Tax=Cyprideis torosa TaxID=163714 RepID=A0A7R8W906_9CRUS|nr:unnamed protein product [Cyprideis torosa]CAG0886820.1 unnamed protein product [Cyprideis torosa]
MKSSTLLEKRYLPSIASLQKEDESNEESSKILEVSQQDLFQLFILSRLNEYLRKLEDGDDILSNVKKRQFHAITEILGVGSDESNEEPNLRLSQNSKTDSSFYKEDLTRTFLSHLDEYLAKLEDYDDDTEVREDTARVDDSQKFAEMFLSIHAKAAFLHGQIASPVVPQLSLDLPIRVLERMCCLSAEENHHIEQQLKQREKAISILESVDTQVGRLEQEVVAASLKLSECRQKGDEKKRTLNQATTEFVSLSSKLEAKTERVKRLNNEITSIRNDVERISREAHGRVQVAIDATRTIERMELVAMRSVTTPSPALASLGRALCAIILASEGGWERTRALIGGSDFIRSLGDAVSISGKLSAEEARRIQESLKDIDRQDKKFASLKCVPTMLTWCEEVLHFISANAQVKELNRKLDGLGVDLKEVEMEKNKMVTAMDNCQKICQLEKETFQNLEQEFTSLEKTSKDLQQEYDLSKAALNGVQRENENWITEMETLKGHLNRIAQLSLMSAFLEVYGPMFCEDGTRHSFLDDVSRRILASDWSAVMEDAKTLAAKRAVSAGDLKLWEEVSAAQRTHFTENRFFCRLLSQPVVICWDPFSKTSNWLQSSLSSLTTQVLDARDLPASWLPPAMNSETSTFILLHGEGNLSLMNCLTHRTTFGRGQRLWFMVSGKLPKSGCNIWETSRQVGFLNAALDQQVESLRLLLQPPNFDLILERSSKSRKFIELREHLLETVSSFEIKESQDSATANIIRENIHEFRSWEKSIGDISKLSLEISSLPLSFVPSISLDPSVLHTLARVLCSLEAFVPSVSPLLRVIKRRVETSNTDTIAEDVLAITQTEFWVTPKNSSFARWLKSECPEFEPIPIDESVADWHRLALIFQLRPDRIVQCTKRFILTRIGSAETSFKKCSLSTLNSVVDMSNTGSPPLILTGCRSLLLLKKLQTTDELPGFSTGAWITKNELLHQSMPRLRPGTELDIGGKRRQR